MRRGAARACRLETRLQSARSALCVGFLGRLRRRAGGGEGEQRGEGRQREARRGACSGRSFRALSCARVFWRPVRLTAGRRIRARVRCAAWRGCRRRLWVIQLREKKLRAALGHRASARRVDAAFAARLGRRQVQRRHRHAADRLLRAVRLAGSDRRSDRGDRGDVLRHRAQPRRRGLLGRRAEAPRLPTEAERSTLDGCAPPAVQSLCCCRTARLYGTRLQQAAALQACLRRCGTPACSAEPCACARRCAALALEAGDRLPGGRPRAGRAAAASAA